MVSGLGLLFEHDSSLVGPNLLKLYGTEDVLGDVMFYSLCPSYFPNYPLYFSFTSPMFHLLIY